MCVIGVDEIIDRMLAVGLLDGSGACDHTHTHTHTHTYTPITLSTKHTLSTLSTKHTKH